MPSASMAAIAAAMLAYFMPSTSATACVDSLECSAIASFASASVSPVALTVAVSSLLVADSSFAAVVSSCWVASCEAFASSSAYAVKGTLSEAAIASATAVESVYSLLTLLPCDPTLPFYLSFELVWINPS